jgi:mono/diheme cytochrome c family protein
VRTAGTIAALALLAAGCTRGSTSSRPPIHLNPNMDDQPRYEAQAESGFFADGKAMREPVPGTVARDDLVTAPAFVTGQAGGVPVDTLPIPVDDALLARGAERFGIYCGPCHADDGSGQSMLRERAGVATADLTQPRLIEVSDGYLFEVITNGFGLMPSYRYPIPPRDRWAIIAWVRHLQAEAGSGGAAAPPAAGGEPAIEEVTAPAGAAAGEIQGEAP